MSEKHVILVQPKAPDFGWGSNTERLMTAGIFTVASYVPPDISLEIIFDNGQPLERQVNRAKNALVGITGTTCLAERVHELANEAVDLGAYVVFGGTDATIREDDYQRVIKRQNWKERAAVITGEVEGGSFSQVLTDYRTNQPLRLTYGTPHVNLRSIPLPRQAVIDLVKEADSNRVSHARGCPRSANPCDFCTVHLTSGSGLRYRPVEEVMVELEARGLLNGSGYTVFTSDNVGFEKDFELLQEILKRKRGSFNFFLQSELGTLRNQRFLQLLNSLGTVEIGVGVESVFRDQIPKVKRGVSGLDPVDIIRRVRQYPNISILGLIILGWDWEPEDRFDQTLEGIKQLQFDRMYLSILTPLPGTKVRHDLERADRLIPSPWSMYDCRQLTFLPKCTLVDGTIIDVTPEDFITGFTRLKSQLTDLLPTWSKWTQWAKIKGGDGALAI